jgi:hypothetical protein
LSGLPETWAIPVALPVGWGQAASPKSKRRHQDKKDNRYGDCLAPVVISERPEQVNHSDKNHDRRYGQAAAIKVPDAKSVHTVAGTIHISPDAASSKS